MTCAVLARRRITVVTSPQAAYILASTASTPARLALAGFIHFG